ncbi:MAG TPA: glycosyltransferase family 2 protein [Anaerolineales bacterium]|nr:glycosyltransferase family 2 protein [Anaerolineales bacterium]
MSQTILLILAIPIAAILLVFTIRRILFTLAILPSVDLVSQHPTPDHGCLPEVLILVPCRDERSMVPGLCQALAQLDYPGERLQVVLIDDASMDGTGLVMEQQAAERPGWNVLPLFTNVGKARALNIALDRFPFGEIVYIFDADHRPDPQALRRGVRYFFAPRVSAVTGFTRVVNPLASPSAFYSTVESYTNQLVTMRAKDRLGLAPALLGSNCAYRRELLIASGGFRNGSFSEDSDLTVTFYRAGYRIRFAQDAISSQQVPQSMDGYLKQHIRWGRGLNDVAKVHAWKVLTDEKLTLPLRVELLLFAAGYLDRLALLSALLLMVFSYLLGSALVFPLLEVILFSLATPLGQVVALFFKERMGMAMWIRLPLIPLFFAFDIFAAVRSMLETLLNQPRLWTKTQREEVP